jgi:hypothetical protein
MRNTNSLKLQRNWNFELDTGKAQLAGQVSLQGEAAFDEQQKTRRSGDLAGVYGVSSLGLS